MGRAVHERIDTPPHDERTRGGDSVRGLRRIVGGNVRALMWSQAAMKVAGFVSMAVLARFLGAEGFGRYTGTIALVSLLTVVAEFGTGHFLVREGGRRPHDLGSILGQVLGVRLTLAFAMVTIVVPLGVVIGYDVLALASVVLFAVAAALRLIAGAYILSLQALERLPESAAAEAHFSVAQAAASIVAAVAFRNVVAVGFAILIVSAVFPVYARIRFRRRWPDRVRIRGAGVMDGLRRAGPFAASAVLFTTLAYLDAILLHGIRGEVETGLYGAAYRIALALEVIPTVLVAAITRSMSYYAARDRLVMIGLYRRATAYLVILAIAVAIGGAMLSGEILTTVFGDPYRRAAPALALLLAGVVVWFPAWAQTVAGYAIGAEKALMKRLAIAVAFNAAANLVVIPRWGILGAAATTAATQALFVAAMTVVLRREGVRLALHELALKPLLAALAMIAVVLPLRGAPLPVPVLAGAVTYIGALVALRGITRQDIRLLAETVRGRAT